MEARLGTCCSCNIIYLCDGAQPESLTEAVMMLLAGLNSSCTVVVTVQDENNNPPVFSQHEVRKHALKQTHTVTYDARVYSGHDKQYLWKKGRPNITGQNKWLLDCRL